ncbi:RNA polymerase II assembly factor like protein [Tanacetum coccineum]
MLATPLVTPSPNVPRKFIFGTQSVTFQCVETCTPNLAAFVAGLGHIQFEKTDNNSKVSASWELFHMLLKERHWALAHLAMTAFGYFSAALLVAALSLVGGVLEKEVANVKTTPGSNELALHVKEGLLLKQMAHKMMTIDSDAMEIDDTTQY